MRSGEARAHLTNSPSASFRVGGGSGRQNSFMLRDPASCSISNETAPCAKPLQKLTAALAIALSDCGSHSATRSPVVLAAKSASVTACPTPGAVTRSSAAAAVHLLNVMITYLQRLFRRALAVRDCQVFAGAWDEASCNLMTSGSNINAVPVLP